jgi:hypothetical protein
MRRYRRDRADRRAVLVQRHHDFVGVQVQAGPAASRRGAIDVVAEDRPAHLGAMHAQLMRAAREWFEREPCELFRSRIRCIGLHPAHHRPGGR